MSGIAKAIVAGIATGGGGLAIVLGADPDIVAAILVVLNPLFVYLVPNE